jgi:hypothetical protein
MPLVGLLLLLVNGQDADKPMPLEAQFQALNLADARKWEMFLDASQQTKAELIERPIYLWTNPTKGKGQHGSVFVWTYKGRPMVVGSVFIDRTIKTQRMMHEFHTLAPEVLHPRCLDCEGQSWEPMAGITLKPLEGAPPPESSPAKRLLQIRAIARDFGGHTFDNWRQLRWQLRSLPQPLYRYQQPDGETIDGALLALLNDAGTDPEVLLLLEARRDGWYYAPLRFADASLYVEFQGKEVWTAVRGEEEQPAHNAHHTYQFLRMRFLDPSELPLPATQP